MDAQVQGMGLTEATLIELVTYKKDGSAVGTPVMSTPCDGALLIRTHHTAGKLKRLRHNRSVDVTPCDGRGRHRGKTEQGTARILPTTETARCLELMHRRHGFVGRAFTLLRHLRRLQDVFIEVRLV